MSPFSNICVLRLISFTIIQNAHYDRLKFRTLFRSPARWEHPISPRKVPLSGERSRSLSRCSHMTSICETDATITSATLDIEPRRLTLIIPGLYVLDIDLNLSDSALERALFPIGTSPQEIEHALMLKRGRNFDVDGARAEWRMKGRC